MDMTRARGVVSGALKRLALLAVAGLWLVVTAADFYVAWAVYCDSYENGLRSAIAFVLFSLPNAYCVLWLCTRRAWRKCKAGTPRRCACAGH